MRINHPAHTSPSSPKTGVTHRLPTNPKMFAVVALTFMLSINTLLFNGSYSQPPQYSGRNAPDLVTITFTPIADSYVHSISPTMTYGKLLKLRGDNFPVVRSYLRFDIQGLTERVTSATLRVYANSLSIGGYEIRSVADNTWKENSITFATSPQVGDVLGSSGPFLPASWTSVDVTSYITGNGVYSLALTVPGITAISFASRESGDTAPQLVIVTGTESTPTSTPEPESSSTPTLEPTQSSTSPSDPTGDSTSPADVTELPTSSIDSTLLPTDSTPDLSSTLDSTLLPTDSTPAPTSTFDLTPLPTDSTPTPTTTFDSTPLPTDSTPVPTAIIDSPPSPTPTLESFPPPPATPIFTASPTPTPTATQPGSYVLVGAGDISSCGNNNDELTARLVDNIPGTVFTAGDNAYTNGTYAQYMDCYDPTWGRSKARTYPSPGNHEYNTSAASGYFQYFSSVASYYAYNLGSWRIYSLNSEINISATSPQVTWLVADLASNPTQCVMAYWHKPRWSSGAEHGSDPSMQNLWAALQNAGAELVVNGHEHNYERFAQMDGSGTENSQGLREFVVGTGGAGHYGFGNILSSSQVRDNNTYGVLKLTLSPGQYTWQFVPVAGATFTDSGTTNCH